MSHRSLNLRRLSQPYGLMSIAALAAALVVVACTSDVLGPVPRSLEATPAEKLLAPRDTFRIVVLARGSNGELIARSGAAFRSTVTPVARVDDRGLVTAVSPGMAHIVVETAHAADTVHVNVQP